MLLSSIDRANLYIKLESNRENRRWISSWLLTLSDKIEEYLCVELQIKERTEYFDTTPYKYEYFAQAAQIISISSVKTRGLNGEDYTAVTGYTTGKFNESVLLSPNTQLWERNKGLELVYTGGLAYHGSQSIYKFTGTGDKTALPTKYVYGTTSESVGIVKSYDALTGKITVDVLAGIFVEGEVMQVSTALDGANDAAFSFTLSEKVELSLCEKYTGFARALEIESRFFDKHAYDFENQSTLEGQTTRRTSDSGKITYDLQPETESLIRAHARIRLAQ